MFDFFDSIQDIVELIQYQHREHFTLWQWYCIYWRDAIGLVIMFVKFLWKWAGIFFLGMYDFYSFLTVATPIASIYLVLLMFLFLAFWVNSGVEYYNTKHAALAIANRPLPTGISLGHWYSSSYMLFNCLKVSYKYML